MAAQGVTKGMQTAPTLATRASGHGKQLSLSLLIGALGTVGVCAALALIVLAREIFTETTVDPESLTMHFVEPVKKKEMPQTDHAPERIITVPTGPAFVMVRPDSPTSDLPQLLEVPQPEETRPDLLVLEELDTENPFEEKAEPKTPKTIAVATQSTPAKKSGPTPAELAKREEQRRASLARKISQQASVIATGTPNYPKSARSKGHQGRAVVIVTVGTSGQVSSCQLSQSSGYSSLDQSALSAARRYRFSPAKNGLGQPVSVKKAIPFNFQLSS